MSSRCWSGVMSSSRWRSASGMRCNMARCGALAACTSRANTVSPDRAAASAGSGSRVCGVDSIAPSGMAISDTLLFSDSCRNFAARSFGDSLTARLIVDWEQPTILASALTPGKGFRSICASASARACCQVIRRDSSVASASTRVVRGSRPRRASTTASHVPRWSVILVRHCSYSAVGIRAGNDCPTIVHPAHTARSLAPSVHPIPLAIAQLAAVRIRTPWQPPLLRL